MFPFYERRAVNRGYDQVVTRATRLFLAAAMLAVLLPAVQARAAEPHILVATLNGVINPITDNYISTAVDKAVSGQANTLIIAMDTPGGLDTSMRQSINAPADDAVKLGVVDFESRDLDTLLQDLDARQVSKGGQTYTLQTAKAGIERYDMSGFDQFLQAVADPNLVYLLFLLALIGIGFWVTPPGMFLPGVIRVIAGVLAAVSMFDLPVNIAGIILILIAVLLFIIDLKAVTHGVLTTGGIVAMTLGGLLLINTSFLAEGVNIPLLVITVLVIAAVFLFILRKLLDARRRPYAAGEESMTGSLGSVREPLNPSGMVFVNGALWQATSTGGPLEAGAQVRVVGVDGLHLRVEPLQQPQAGRSDGPQVASS